MTARLDLTASRNETWRPTIDLAYSGDPLPLTGATIKMQWRLYEGAPGAPLLDFGDVPFEDILATAEDVANGVASPGDRILRLLPIMIKSALEALPTGVNQPEIGEADRFAWDAVIHYADDVEERIVAGVVDLSKGVTVDGD